MSTAIRIAAGCLGVALTICPAATFAVQTSPPAAANAAIDAPVISEAEQSLLLQLADAEANIKALNLALARAGYKVGQAYSRIDSGQKGNALMDRNGGGPVGWRDFYGRTARGFYVPDAEAAGHSQDLISRSDVHVTVGNHPLERPGQFDSIYKANDEQVARAKEQVAALSQDQATLLARRQKHEADQSRLWAMLAFERITNREIADEPICRFKLKGVAGGSETRVQVIRAVTLFLRTTDQLAAACLDVVKPDQSAAFTAMDPQMKSAYATLRASMVDAAVNSPDDKKLADSLKSICKSLWDESAIVVDNYRNALDRDQAKEDSSKLVFREKLQESLAKFAAMTAELDTRVSETAKTWNVTVDKSTPTPDTLPDLKIAVSQTVAPDAQRATRDQHAAVDAPQAATPDMKAQPAPFSATDWNIWCWSGSTWDQFPLDKMRHTAANGMLTLTNNITTYQRTIVCFQKAVLAGDFQLTAEYKGNAESFDLQASDGSNRYVDCPNLPAGANWHRVQFSRTGGAVRASVDGQDLPTTLGHASADLSGVFVFKLRQGQTLSVRNVKIESPGTRR